MLWFPLPVRQLLSCGGGLFSNDPGGAVPPEVYGSWVEAFRRHYMPVIPYLGTFGLEASFALNRYFRKQGIPLRASWSVGKRRLWRSIEAMLSNDIPVVLAVGANLPIPLRRHKVNFYRAGQTAPATRTAAHFVAVTGMDGQDLRISSWGREYRIRREEFWDYARRHSSFFVSNILWVWPG